LPCLRMYNANTYRCWPTGSWLGTAKNFRIWRNGWQA